MGDDANQFVLILSFLHGLMVGYFGKFHTVHPRGLISTSNQGLLSIDARTGLQYWPTIETWSSTITRVIPQLPFFAAFNCLGIYTLIPLLHLTALDARPINAAAPPDTEGEVLEITQWRSGRD